MKLNRSKGFPMDIAHLEKPAGVMSRLALPAAAIRSYASMGTGGLAIGIASSCSNSYNVLSGTIFRATRIPPPK